MDKFKLFVDMYGIRALARDCQITNYQTIQKWLIRGRVPIAHLATMERISGIPRQELNPTPFIGMVA